MIVTDPMFGTRAAYAPAIAYPCELEYHSVVCKDDSKKRLIVYFRGAELERGPRAGFHVKASVGVRM